MLVAFSMAMRDNSFIIDGGGTGLSMAVTALVDELASDARYRMGLVLVRIIEKAYREKGDLDSVFKILFSGYGAAIQALIKDSNEFKMIVRLLLELDTDINARDDNGNSVLGQYVYFLGYEFRTGFYPFVYDANHKSIVQLLLEKGADVSIIDDVDEYSALHLALDTDCDVEIIKMLVEAGASLESVSAGGSTPLFLAIKNYNKDTITFLIETGVDINTSSFPFDMDMPDTETSPLIYLVVHMARSGSDDTYLLRLFLQAGAEVNYRDHEGDSVLHHAVGTQLFEEAVCMLVRFGAEINYKNHAGQTPLHYTVEYAPWLVPCLIQCGADPLIADNKGKIPFDLYTGDDESIAILLSAKKPNQ